MSKETRLQEMRAAHEAYLEAARQRREFEDKHEQIHKAIEAREDSEAIELWQKLKDGRRALLAKEMELMQQDEELTINYINEFLRRKD